MIQTEIVTDLARIDAAQWETLIARCPDSTVFQTREWISSWWTSFARPDMQVHAIAAYDGGELVGLAPLYRTSRRSFGLHVAELRFLGEGPSDYNLFLIQDDAPEITDRLVAEMERELRNNTAIMLADVPQFSSLAFCLSARRGRTITDLRKVSDTPCPRLRLSGNSAGVAAILRKESLRRHYKALSKIGPVSALHHTTPGSIKALLPDLYRQHIARWSGTASPSLFLSPASRKFYESLADSLGREGKIILTELRAGERLAALHFGLRSGNEFIWYKPAFDPDLTRQGPGEVLLKVLIELARANDYSDFDFSRGDESFKMRFATSVDHNATYEWVPRHVPHVFGGATRALRRGLSHHWRQFKSRYRDTGARVTARRLLLLDLPLPIADRLITVLKDEGFEADIASGELPRADVASSRAGTAHNLPADPGCALPALYKLDRQRQYELLIPFSESLIPSLGTLPNDDSLRIKCPVPESSALSAAARQFPAIPSGEIGLTAAGGALGGSRSLTVQCLCAHGRLAWYRLLDEEPLNTDRLTWVVPQCAKRVLERLGWHGFATLTFDAAADGRTTVKRFAPLLVPSGGDEHNLARFIASAWAMTRLRQVPPQPQDFMSSLR